MSYNGFDYGQEQMDPAMLEAMLYAMMSGDPAFDDVNAPAFDQGQMNAMWGMVPDVQPGTGKPLTVANQTSALNANRTALFDTAMAGFGGADAFAADAFTPSVSTEVVQSPELQTIYGYLRSPDSLEGLIASELMAGGTSATAVRKMRQLLVDPNVDPTLKENLLLELQPLRDIDNQPMEMTPDGANVDWEDATTYARSIAEQWAGIPAIGPTAPQFDPETQSWTTGGEMSWGVDDKGAPVMIKTTTTPTGPMKKYDTLGLPYPTDEYAAEDFMDPETVAMRDLLGQMEQPVAQAKAAWMDPSLAPSNWEQTGPAGVPAAPGWGGPGAQGSAQPAPSGVPSAGSLLDIMGQNPSGDTGGFLNSLLRQGLYDIATGNEGEGQPGGGPREGAVNDVIANTGTLGGAELADVILQNPSGDTGGFWNSFTRQGLVDILTGNEGSGGQPSGPDYPAGDPASYEEFLVQQGGALAPGQRDYAYGDWNQEPAPQPGAPNNLAGAFQSLIQAGQPAPQISNAMLAQILGGGQQLTPQTPARQPGGPGFQQEPGYQQGAGQQARQPGGASYREAVETGEGRAARRREDEQQAQVLGGSTDRTGKRVRPTRTPEQARRYRQAFNEWDLATDERQRMIGQAHTYQSGQALGQAWKLQQQGVRPLDQVLMARRLMLMGAGMPSSGYIPGT